MTALRHLWLWIVTRPAVWSRRLWPSRNVCPSCSAGNCHHDEYGLCIYTDCRCGWTS